MPSGCTLTTCGFLSTEGGNFFTDFLRKHYVFWAGLSAAVAGAYALLCWIDAAVGPSYPSSHSVHTMASISYLLINNCVLSICVVLVCRWTGTVDGVM